MKEICHFKFKRKLSRETIEDFIILAIISTESVFGQSAVRLNARYTAVTGQAVIDVSSKVGENLAQVFTGLVSTHLGEDSFVVRRKTIKETHP